MVSFKCIATTALAAFAIPALAANTARQADSIESITQSLQDAVEEFINAFNAIQLPGDESTIGDSVDQVIDAITQALRPGSGSLPSFPVPTTTTSTASSSTTSTVSSSTTSTASSSTTPTPSSSTGSPSGISLSSGDDTISSLLAPLSGLLSGGAAKRAVAFEA